jgi:segregation and condensation protein A
MSGEKPSEAVTQAELPSTDGGAVEPEASAERAPASEDTAKASSPSPEGLDSYRVSLPMFEGPLDLLLHLVQKHELDILDIPIAFVTEKYTAYIRMMDELNIDLASEYLVMAATLVHIKSRMLLPNAPVDEEEEAEELGLDPRADLVRRLLEYQKYKGAAEQLAQRSVLGRDVFPRGTSLETVGGAMPLAAVSMFQLIDVFQSVLERTAQTRQHEIDFERFSISEKITELMDRLRSERRVEFAQIFSGDRSRGEMIITFLALLEMTRLRLTWLFQDGPLEPIFVELRASEEDAEEAHSAEARDGAIDGADEPAAGGDASAREPFEPDVDEAGAGHELSTPDLDEEGAAHELLEPAADEDDAAHDLYEAAADEDEAEPSFNDTGVEQP